jgi:hypothetical protein
MTGKGGARPVAAVQVGFDARLQDADAALALDAVPQRET